MLALLGGHDDSAPVTAGVARIAAALSDVGRHRHGIAAFPGADHSLSTVGPRPGTGRRGRLAAGFLHVLTAFLE